MGKFWIMGGTMAVAFVAGVYVFMPDQQGKLLPDFSGLASKFQPAVLPTPTPESNPHPLFPDDKAKNGIKRLEDGSVVVDKALPPEMDKLNQDIAQMTVELQEKKAEIGRKAVMPVAGGAEQAIQQANKLIAETEQKNGLDTAHDVEAILTSRPTITDPDLKQLETKLDTVGHELEGIERHYQK